MHAEERPLRIALLAYRGKPHVGGQGVYVRHLAKALTNLGHHVEVLGGQPYPVVDDRIPLVELPSLDIYNDYFPMRMPGLWELKRWTDFVEVAAFSAGHVSEHLALTLRRWYSFTAMQTRVATRLSRVITVSENSFNDIVADHGVDPARMAIVPVGVDVDLFQPLPGVEPVPGRLITTASA